MSDNNKQQTWSLVISIFSILLTIGLGFIVYFQNERINVLGKSQMANDILISSPNMDTENSVHNTINISINVVSNYDGAMPITYKLIEVRKNSEEIRSEYSHNRLNKTEQTIKKDDEIIFKEYFKADNPGDYELDYIFYYNYPQDEDYQKGKSKTFTLKLLVEK